MLVRLIAVLLFFSISSINPLYAKVEGEADKEAEKAAVDQYNKQEAEFHKARPKEAEEDLEIVFIRFEPNLVTNLKFSPTGRPHYVHMQIELMARGKENGELVRLHLPLVQDAYILYLNNLSRADLRPGEPRDAVKQHLLELTREIYKKQTGKPLVNKVLLTKVYTE